MEENRNCSCQEIDNINMQINTNIDMNYNDCECDDSKNMTRKEMLKKIKCLRFAVIELALYLDTHPDDTKALCLHNKYSKELKEICDKYQKVYGPLTIEYPCNKWRWLEEPWPWEGGLK